MNFMVLSRMLMVVCLVGPCTDLLKLSMRYICMYVCMYVLTHIIRAYLRHFNLHFYFCECTCVLFIQYGAPLHRVFDEMSVGT